MALNAFCSHEARFPPVASSASKARDFVRHCLVEHEMAYLVDDIRLVVSELATNAVVHARREFTVTIDSLSFCVALTVRHGSTSSPPADGRPGVTMAHGMDVVIERCSSDWGVLAGDIGDEFVWATFAVRPGLMTAQSASDHRATWNESAPCTATGQPFSDHSRNPVRGVGREVVIRA